MTAKANTMPLTPFTAILTWSQDKPLWQRDALRRIILSGMLAADDLKELLGICRIAHGLEHGPSALANAVPLESSHLPGGSDGSSSVSLVRLSEVNNVDGLVRDQTIDFGPAIGLTVIFGENGSGKSGYARIVKRACKSRGGVPVIKANVFAPTPSEPARASIEFHAGSVGVRVNWKDGNPPEPRLNSIFVFDALSAKAHVGEDGPACFKPSGLSVLPELARACDVIKAELQSELDVTSAQITIAAASWLTVETTAVGKLLRGLSAKTKREAVEALAVFTAAQEERLADLVAVLSDSPKQRSAETSAATRRLRAFLESVSRQTRVLADEEMQRLADAIRHEQATAKAASVAAGPELAVDDLVGTCGEVWRQLWNAARAYSMELAYPGEPFPVATAGARCVLCQQPLGDEARDRYGRFQRFVADATRRQAEAASLKLAELREVVDSCHPLGPHAGGIRADLDREAPGMFESVERYVASLDARLAHAVECLPQRAWTVTPPLAPWPEGELSRLIERLERRAMEELLADDPERRRTLNAERAELADQKWLAANKEVVISQISRYEHSEKLRECQRDCTTNAITHMSSELHATHVTSAFCEAFLKELKELKLATLPVKLQAIKGTKGDHRFAIKLEGAPSAKAIEVASEGEHRCIALAAFLAELTLASHKSALVFDDPVSSVDHLRRGAIAVRLVKEAAIRQVIVFTHDLAFMCDLKSAADACQVSVHYQQIERMAGKPGCVVGELPWDAQSPKQQLKSLREQIATVDKVHREQGETDYRAQAMPVVGRLRGTCERLIELTLLNGVVKRHDSKINVGYISSVAVVTKEQWATVHAIWKRCSNVVDSHAVALSGPVNLPTPEELKEWLMELSNILEAVNRAREGLKATKSKHTSKAAS